nr:MAG TPA: hypothetical protein [Caudoviricetes sp.]
MQFCVKNCIPDKKLYAKVQLYLRIVRFSDIL